MARNRAPLQLDRQRRKFLGVCAGLARYMDVEPLSVRLVFIACVVFGAWFLVPAYFVAWFLLDDNTHDTRQALADNRVVKHFRTVDYRKGIYRNTRKGRWLGVCAGVADYLEISPFAVRLLVVLAFFLSGGLALLAYLAAWLVMDKLPEHYLPAPERQHKRHSCWHTRQDRDEPPVATAHEAGECGAAAAARAHGHGGFRARHAKGAPLEEDLQDELQSRRGEIKYCARKLLALQARLARMEAYVTSRRFRLHREFRNIS